MSQLIFILIVLILNLKSLEILLKSTWLIYWKIRNMYKKQNYFVVSSVQKRQKVKISGYKDK